jgi:hypothetical protein
MVSHVSESVLCDLLCCTKCCVTSSPVVISRGKNDFLPMLPLIHLCIEQLLEVVCHGESWLKSEYGVVVGPSPIQT